MKQENYHTRLETLTQRTQQSRISSQKSFPYLRTNFKLSHEMDSLEKSFFDLGAPQETGIIGRLRRLVVGPKRSRPRPVRARRRLQKRRRPADSGQTSQQGNEFSPSKVDPAEKTENHRILTDSLVSYRSLLKLQHPYANPYACRGWKPEGLHTEDPLNHGSTIAATAGYESVRAYRTVLYHSKLPEDREFHKRLMDIRCSWNSFYELGIRPDSGVFPETDPPTSWQFYHDFQRVK